MRKRITHPDIGSVFTRLTVLKSFSKDGKTVSECICECGKVKILSLRNLITGATKSCGCIKRDGVNKKHGMCKTSEYVAWSSMKSRCYKPLTSWYKAYGGRGIGVCREWRDSFDSFINDMGPKPSPDYSLDRIDVNGDYSPNNCRWATLETQSENKRNSIKIMIYGESLTPKQIAKKYKINKKTLMARIVRGYSIEQAVSVKIKNCGKPTHKRKC